MMTAAAPYTGFTADPVVPSRECLLDPGFVADRLGHIFGRPVSNCSLRRAKYRLGESLRADVDLGTGSPS